MFNILKTAVLMAAITALFMAVGSAIGGRSQGRPMEVAERHPETAQMMIMNPLSGGGLRGLFSTHPPTEERVERLLAMAQGADA